MSDATLIPRQPMIEIEGLHKHFGDNHVLRGINLVVAAGEVVCIIGPSGSGKSTLLRCINHLEIAEEGLIRIEGQLAYHKEHNGVFRPQSNRAISAVRAQVGLVFQQFNLFPHLTVMGNVIEAPVRVGLVADPQPAIASAQIAAESPAVSDAVRPTPSWFNF